MFAQVQNGVVISEMTDVPESFDNVSGFRYADSATKIAKGFYPLVEVRDTFDPATHKLPATPTYAIGASQVTATYTKIALTTAELDAAKQAQRDGYQSQITAIEAATHMNRFVREAMILISQQQATALGLTEPQLYAANIGYKRVKDVDTQIVALRTAMEAIV